MSNQFGDREAVVHLGERDLAARIRDQSPGVGVCVARQLVPASTTSLNVVPLPSMDSIARTRARTEGPTTQIVSLTRDGLVVGAGLPP